MTSCRLIPMPCASQGPRYVSTHSPLPFLLQNQQVKVANFPAFAVLKTAATAICKLSIKHNLARLPASGLLAVGSICMTPLLFTTLFVGVLEVQGLTRLGTCTGQE